MEIKEEKSFDTTAETPTKFYLVKRGRRLRRFKSREAILEEKDGKLYIIEGENSRKQQRWLLNGVESTETNSPYFHDNRMICFSFNVSNPRRNELYLHFSGSPDSSVVVKDAVYFSSFCNSLKGLLDKARATSPSISNKDVEENRAQDLERLRADEELKKREKEIKKKSEELQKKEQSIEAQLQDIKRQLSNTGNSKEEIDRLKELERKISEQQREIDRNRRREEEEKKRIEDERLKYEEDMRLERVKRMNRRNTYRALASSENRHHLVVTVQSVKDLENKDYIIRISFTQGKFKTKEDKDNIWGSTGQRRGPNATWDVTFEKTFNYDFTLTPQDPEWDQVLAENWTGEEEIKIEVLSKDVRNDQLHGVFYFPLSSLKMNHLIQGPGIPKSPPNDREMWYLPGSGSGSASEDGYFPLQDRNFIPPWRQNASNVSNASNKKYGKIKIQIEYRLEARERENKRGFQSNNAQTDFSLKTESDSLSFTRGEIELFWRTLSGGNQFNIQFSRMGCPPTDFQKRFLWCTNVEPPFETLDTIQWAAFPGDAITLEGVNVSSIQKVSVVTDYTDDTSVFREDLNFEIQGLGWKLEVQADTLEQRILWCRAFSWLNWVYSESARKRREHEMARIRIRRAIRYQNEMVGHIYKAKYSVTPNGNSVTPNGNSADIPEGSLKEGDQVLIRSYPEAEKAQWLWRALERVQKVTDRENISFTTSSSLAASKLFKESAARTGSQRQLKIAGHDSFESNYRINSARQSSREISQRSTHEDSESAISAWADADDMGRFIGHCKYRNHNVDFVIIFDEDLDNEGQRTGEIRWNVDILPNQNEVKEGDADASISEMSQRVTLKKDGNFQLQNNPVSGWLWGKNPKMKVKDFGQSIDITESEISCINNYWQGTLIAVNDADVAIDLVYCDSNISYVLDRLEPSERKPISNVGLNVSFTEIKAVPSDYCVWEYDKAAIIQKVKQEVTKDFGQSDQNKVSKVTSAVELLFKETLSKEITVDGRRLHAKWTFDTKGESSQSKSSEDDPDLVLKENLCSNLSNLIEDFTMHVMKAIMREIEVYQSKLHSHFENDSSVYGIVLCSFSRGVLEIGVNSRAVIPQKKDSQSDGREMTVTFTNNSGYSVNLYVVNDQGKEEYEGLLRNDSEITKQTFSETQWRIRSNNDDVNKMVADFICGFGSGKYDKVEIQRHTNNKFPRHALECIQENPWQTKIVPASRDMIEQNKRENNENSPLTLKSNDYSLFSFRFNVWSFAMK